VWKEIKGEYEHAVLIESTQKSLDTGTGGAGGGYVVPVQTLPDSIERLYANLVVKQAGATVLPNLIGSPVYIPKQLTSADIYWIGQNTPITLSNPNAEELMRRDFARIAALELDRVVLRGAGTLEPLGIANTTNIPTLALGTDGDAFDWAAAVDAEGMLEDASALVPDGKLAFITHGKVKRRLVNPHPAVQRRHWWSICRSPDYLRSCASRYVGASNPNNLAGPHESDKGHWVQLIGGLLCQLGRCADRPVG
jgi:hypothetical protein